MGSEQHWWPAVTTFTGYDGIAFKLIFKIWKQSQGGCTQADSEATLFNTLRLSVIVLQGAADSSHSPAEEDALITVIELQSRGFISVSLASRHIIINRNKANNTTKENNKMSSSTPG